MAQPQQLRLRYALKIIIILSVLLTISGSVIGQKSEVSASTKPVAPVNTAVAKTIADPDGNKAVKQADDNKGDDRKTSDDAIADRLNALENAVRAQDAKIAQMNQIIAQQQSLIQQLSGRPNNPGAGGQPGATTATNLPPSNSAGNAAAIGNNQTQTAATAQKADDQGIKIGNIRFSGDFRLRLDGTFRGSDPNPPAGFAALPIVQNVHPTYRFRLNMDTDVSKTISFHGQLATGPINDPLSTDQDFSATVTRQPFFINEAWIDYHPNKSLDFQAGRLQEIFADNSRFLFDDDVRFNGFNEQYTLKFKKPRAGFTSIEFRAGQYIFSNPNVAVVTAGSPLAQAGATIGKIGRNSNLFHQGILFNETINKKFNQQFGVDFQLYRNPNEIQLASTANGVTLIVYPGLGLTLSGPIGDTGNATTTAGGAIYTAQSFRIGRFTYRLNYAGFKAGSHDYPITFNVQGARNLGIDVNQRNAFLANVQIGKVTKLNDMSFSYLFAIKGANSMISQLTDNNLGTGSGVNIRTHMLRFDYGLSKRITFQSLFFIQNELSNSGAYPNFFVPLNAYTPQLYRFQEQILFTF